MFLAENHTVKAARKQKETEALADVALLLSAREAGQAGARHKLTSQHPEAEQGIAQAAPLPPAGL